MRSDAEGTEPGMAVLPTMGGIHAIRGFDYQATVILDRLFSHFDEHGESATVRPEGVDDLDLAWTEAGNLERRRYEQIKKPRESGDHDQAERIWTLAAVASELLPDAVSHLKGNIHEQVWVLGDDVHDDVSGLIAAGSTAPSSATAAYWSVIHILSRNLTLEGVEKELRRRLLRQQPPSDLPSDQNDAYSRMVAAFRSHVVGIGADPGHADRYREVVGEIHAALPGILSRIRVISAFGSEEEIRSRVYQRLSDRYGLRPAVVEATLFRNLRGFVNDIAKQPGRCFDRDEFEWELRSVWPTMVPIREPPVTDQDHLPRTDLARLFTDAWNCSALEAVGISGSGKTMLAAEVCERSRHLEPDRLVIYVEVVPDTTLRDVLVGIAYHLRRFGIDRPFSAGIDVTSAGDVVLEGLAHAFAAVAHPLLVVVDLVQGTCSETFSRELATFFRSLHASECRIALFGQEDPFRQLSPHERERLRVSRLDVPGLDVEEFVSLGLRRHPGPNHDLLHQVFQRVTAGRASGLYAKLARSLAEAPTLDAMLELARRPPDEILERAEELRFNRVSDRARSAAEQVVCFALPFTRSEAEQAFSDSNVAAAIRELTSLGMLRPAGDDRFEMHEIVRAGLERLIATETRRNAHATLAEHYDRQGDVVAVIFHLDKAGRSADADRRAREAFLLGQRWSGLVGYVISRRLVDRAEVIRTVVNVDEVTDVYLLGDILSTVDGTVDVNELLAALRSQPQRYFSDYNWATALMGCCLSLQPNRLTELLIVALEVADAIPDKEPRRREVALSTVLSAARRSMSANDPRLPEFFDEASAELRRHLLPFMFLDARREALTRALSFISRDVPNHEGPGGAPRVVLDANLETRAQVEDFLSAIPDVEAHVLLVHQSPSFGRLSPLVWHNRRKLRSPCLEILADDVAAPAVQKAAIRVLALLAAQELPDACRALADRKENPLHGFAALAPSLVPTLVDRELYETLLLDPQEDVERRMAALSVLVTVGVDPSALHDALANRGELASPRSAMWKFLLLRMALVRPFTAAVPLMSERLRAGAAEESGILALTLGRLGRLSGDGATDLLLEACGHESPSIRLVSALTLGGRRSRRALDLLKERLRLETEPAVAVQLVTAILASGPHSTADLAMATVGAPDLDLWRCILAARTRDSSFGPELVRFANDATANWQLRRAAIEAAGELPFAAALERILPPERGGTLLTLDQNLGLQAHATLSWLLLEWSGAILPVFVRGKRDFVELVAGILRDQHEDLMDSRGMPSDEAIATWLFDRLLELGWPAELDAPDALITELHLPLLHAAFLRSLRRTNRIDLIETELRRADHPWIALRAILEVARSAHPVAVEHLRGLVSHSPVASDPRLEFILEDMERINPEGSVPEPAVTPDKTTTGTVIGFEEARRALLIRAEGAQIAGNGPFVFETLDREQFDQLVLLADPANEREVPIVRFEPAITLGAETHTVARRSSSWSKSSEVAGGWLRPALVAANRFGARISWHDDAMASPFLDAYVGRLLACLSVSRHPEIFYRMLEIEGDLLLQHVCSPDTRRLLKAIVDERLVPFLTRHVSSGTDEILEGLADLACMIDSARIDDVLAALFRRWTDRILRREGRIPLRESVHLWRAFDSLSSHPRFGLIDDWQDRLASVLREPLPWHDTQRVRQVLERDPRSYVQLETVLFKFEDWVQFRSCQIERQTRVVDRLFRETS